MQEGRLTGPAGFTRRLLGRTEKAAVSLPLKLRPAPGGAPRMVWIADAVKKDALGWLCRKGGWRHLQVVAGGRRREGRVWDARIFPSLGVRFTEAPLHLLVASMKTSVTYPRVGAKLREQVTRSTQGEDPPTGDLLALHRIVSSLRASAGRKGWRARHQGPRCPTCEGPLELPEAGEERKGAGRGRGRTKKPERRPSRCPHCDTPLKASDFQARKTLPKAQLEQALLQLSPLSLAFQPERLGQLDDPAARLAPLFLGDRAVLFSYLDDVLSRAWIEEEQRRRRMPPEEAQASYAASVRGLEAYVLAAEGRPDALRPLIGFFEQYVIRRFGGRAPVTEALRRQAQVFNRASEREAFLRTAAGLFALGRRVSNAVENALAASFVDRSEAEKVLLAQYHERFRDVGPEVEAIRRELAGEIG